jgi:hypothetical protein
MAKQKPGAKVLAEIADVREIYEEVKDLLSNVDYCLAQADGQVNVEGDITEGVFRLNEAKDNLDAICVRIQIELDKLPPTLARQVKTASLVRIPQLSQHRLQQRASVGKIQAGCRVVFTKDSREQMEFSAEPNNSFEASRWRRD